MARHLSGSTRAAVRLADQLHSPPPRRRRSARSRRFALKTLTAAVITLQDVLEGLQKLEVS
jgi:hypothetical protein